MKRLLVVLFSIFGLSVASAQPGPTSSPWTQSNNAIYPKSSSGILCAQGTTGGSKGANTLNCHAIYIDGALVSSLTGVSPPLVLSAGTLSLGFSSFFTVSANSLTPANISAGYLLANCSIVSAAPSGCSPGTFMTQAFGSTRGAILENGLSGWTSLIPGNVGYPLVSNGAADPAYQLLTDTGLASTTVTPGSYVNANITVNQQGRVTGASSGSNTGSFTQPLDGGAGAVARTVTSKLGDTVSVLDYGAVGNGSTPDDTAIGLALTALNTRGGALYFPPRGNYGSNQCYYVTKPILLTTYAVGIYGDSNASQICISTSYSGPVIKVGNATTDVIVPFIRNLFIIVLTGSPAATNATGIYVANANGLVIDTVQIQSVGIDIDIENDNPSSGTTYNIWLNHVVGACTATCLVVGQNGTTSNPVQSVFLRDDEFFGGSLGCIGLYNLYKGLFGSNVATTGCQHGLVTYPGPSQAVSIVYLFAFNSDNETNSGVALYTNGGPVNGITFVDMGAGGSGTNGSYQCTVASAGVDIEGNGTAVMADINFIGGGPGYNCGPGMEVVNARNVFLTGTHIGANGLLTANTYDGVKISNSTHVGISGGSIGFDSTSGQPSPSTQQLYGVEVLGTSDYINVSAVDLSGNGTAAIINTSSGTHNRFTDNPSFNPQPSSNPSILASGSNYFAPPYPVTDYIIGGTGVGLCDGSGCWNPSGPATLALGPNEEYSMTYSTAPTINRVPH